MPDFGPAGSRAGKTLCPPGLIIELMKSHLGICYDTSHSAVAYENPAESITRLQNAGIKISKAQISSALSLVPDSKNLKHLAEFNDQVYLHQVKAKTEKGEIISYPDLPEALEEAGKGKSRDHVEWRVHFHVPLFVRIYDGLHSTSEELDKSFFNILKTSTSHIEIETYTFNVIPERLRPDSVIDSIVSEFKWLFPRLVQ